MKKLVFAIFMGLAVFGLCACSPKVSVSGNAENYTAGNAQIKDPVENLDIEWASGELNIVRGDVGAILLEETYNGDLPDEKKMHWWLDGTTLRVRFDMTLSLGININTNKKLTVTLPKDLKLKDLDVDVASASVKAQEIIAETADLDTASGEIAASFKEAMKEVKIDTASGAISTEFAGAVESLDMDAASGVLKVDAADLVKKVKMDSASGDVIANFGKTPESLDIDTASGKVEIGVPSDADFSLEVDTASGDFNSEIPFSIKGDRYICGSGQASFMIDTASGDVEIHSR